MEGKGKRRSKLTEKEQTSLELSFPSQKNRASKEEKNKTSSRGEKAGGPKRGEEGESGQSSY